MEVSCFLFSDFGVEVRVAMREMLWPPRVSDQGQVSGSPFGPTNGVVL
jgi:hypothetical protein